MSAALKRAAAFTSPTDADADSQCSARLVRATQRATFWTGLPLAPGIVRRNLGAAVRASRHGARPCLILRLGDRIEHIGARRLEKHERDERCDRPDDEHRDGDLDDDVSFHVHLLGAFLCLLHDLEEDAVGRVTPGSGPRSTTRPRRKSLRRRRLLR